MSYDPLAKLGGRQVLRRSDLLSAGLRPREIANLVAAGDLTHPSLPGTGPERGIYATRDALDHPDLAEAVVSVLTGGVLCRQYAAFRHGLATVVPHRMEVLVPASSTIRPRDVYKAIRTRDEEALEVGVECLPNDLGIEILITNRACTTIDLLRSMRRNGDDWRHGVESLRAFVASGGDTAELADLAGRFEAWLPRVLDALGEGLSVEGPRP